MSELETPKLSKAKALFYKITKLKPKAKIHVMRLDGVIASGKKALSLEKVGKTLEKAFKGKPDYVALIINSPGGSPVQSALIGNRIRALSKEHEVKVLCYVEDVAASGGYWLACAGEEIIAMEASIVGSIAVISGGFGFTEVMKKVGVERRLYTAGENKSFLDPFSEEKAEDVERLKSLQLDIHGVFKDWVKARRGDKLKEGLFTGEFWVGLKAKELGLVDHVRDFHADMEARFGEQYEAQEFKLESGFSLRKLIGLQSLTQEAIQDIESRGYFARFGL